MKTKSQIQTKENINRGPPDYGRRNDYNQQTLYLPMDKDITI